MDEYVLERDGLGPLRFNGEKIGELSTFGHDRDGNPKRHWTELQIYRVVPTRDVGVCWVVYSIGQTSVSHESVRCTATVCKTPAEVAGALSPRGQMTAPGFEVMCQAADVDDDLDSWLEDHLARTEEVL